MPSGLVVKVNNFGFDLTFTIVNADGTPRVLTGNTVTLWVYTQEQLPTVVFSGLCTITQPTNGVCTYNVKSTNFTSIGTFNAELEMSAMNTAVPPALVYLEDTETFSINVIARHPVP